MKNQYPGLRAVCRDGAERAVVIGLECASPWLIFEHWREHLPHLRALAQRGAWGTLLSCHPPITVPAWMIMASGANAGEQGVYGFRNRGPSGRYDDLWITSRERFAVPPLWEDLGKHGLRSTVVGVPGSFPPRAFAGKMIPGILTPPDAPKTFPESLWSRVQNIAAHYRYDVADFRHLDPFDLIAQVDAMTRDRFAVARTLADDDDWNLFWLVEIGPDRLHHALWHHIDPRHPRFAAENNPELGRALLAYYQRLDAEVGALWELCDDGDTALLIVSDHGARPMEGGVCLNSWLIDNGYLVLREVPEKPVRFSPDLVDWSQTKAWAAGGYCGRIFLNLQGREPCGTVPPGQARELLETLRHKLEALPGPHDKALQTQAFLPEELYNTRRGFPPDLVVYFDNLALRSLDTVGTDGYFAAHNDTGPDAANHDWEGMVIVAGAGVEPPPDGRLCAQLEEVRAALETLLGVSS